MTRILICTIATVVLFGGVVPADAQTAPAASPAASPAVSPAASPSAAPTATIAPEIPTKESASAAATGTPTTTTGPAKPPEQPCGQLSNPWVMIPLMVGFILLYIWMGRGRRKQEAARKNMLASLKKGDKITTIGGIVGTVIEVKENEVTVKTDEANNVRMKFARWAIRDVGEPGQSPEGEKK